MYKKLLLLLAIVVVAMGCDRKLLEFEHINEPVAKLPVSVYWDYLSGNLPENVRLLVYDQASGNLVKKFTYAYDETIARGEPQTYISLPSGNFRVVVVNEARGEIENMHIADESNYNTLKFRTTNVSDEIDAPYDTTKPYFGQLKGLAVAVVDDVVVTEDVVDITQPTYTPAKSRTDSGTDYISDKLMNIVPERKDVLMHISLYVEGMKNAKLPVLVDLLNIADGYCVATDKNTTSGANMQFYMNNNFADDDTADVMKLTSEVTMFGMQGDRMTQDIHDLEVNPVQFVLRFTRANNAGVETRVMDVKEVIVEEDTDSSKGVIYLKIGLEMTGDDALTAPPITTTPGINPGVDEWDKDDDDKEIVVD